MQSELNLDPDDLDILDEVQDYYGADPEGVSLKAAIYLGVDPDLLQNAKGKPCGESHISADEKCHVGDPEDDKKQQKTDQGAAAFAYKSFKHLNSPDPTGVKGVDVAVNTLADLPNVAGFKDRVRIYDLNPKRFADVQKLIPEQKWPDDKSVRDVLEMLENGNVDGHSFLLCGKYAVDPVLRRKGASHDVINEFCQTMAGVYKAAYIDSTRLPGVSKGTATTAQILGGHVTVVPGNEDDDHPLHSYLKEKYKPSDKWKSAGAVVFNDKGQVLIRKVAGGYGGYEYSWGKGKIDAGETDEQATHREVLEEQGVKGKIVGDLGHHEGLSSTTHFYLLKHESDHPDKMDKETEHTEWVLPAVAAEKLDSARDLKVLVKAMVAMQEHLKK